MIRNVNVAALGKIVKVVERYLYYRGLLGVNLDLYLRQRRKGCS